MESEAAVPTARAAGRSAVAVLHPSVATGGFRHDHLVTNGSPLNQTLALVWTDASFVIMLGKKATPFSEGRGRVWIEDWRRKLFQGS